MSWRVVPPKLMGGASPVLPDMLELFGTLAKLFRLLGLKLSIPSEPVIDMLGPSLLYVVCLL